MRDGRTGLIAPAAILAEIEPLLPHPDTAFDELSSPIQALTPRAAKGLEFDRVVLVEPAAIAARRGRRPPRALRRAHARDEDARRRARGAAAARAPGGGVAATSATAVRAGSCRRASRGRGACPRARTARRGRAAPATRLTSACCSGRTNVIPRAAAAGAAGAADAMDVALVVLGRIEVDHVRDVGQVEPAGGDVGGDERRHLAGAEPGERPLALALRHVAVERERRDVAAPAASARAGRRRAWCGRRRARDRARPRAPRSAGRACRRP